MSEFNEDEISKMWIDHITQTIDLGETQTDDVEYQQKESSIVVINCADGHVNELCVIGLN